MSQGRITPPDVRQAIADLTMQGFSAPDIQRKLDRRTDLEGVPIDLRTIQRWMKAYRPADPSNPWSFADADPEEARLALDIVIHVIDTTDGRLRPTKSDVGWFARIRAADPDIPARWAMPLA